LEHFHCLEDGQLSTPLDITSRHTKYDTTETLISILYTSEGVSSILTGEEAFLDGEIAGRKLILLPDQSTTIGSFRVASPSITSAPE
jgi:hypothetical protein